MRKKLTGFHIFIVLVLVIVVFAPVAVFAEQIVKDKDGKVRIVKDKDEPLQPVSGLTSEKDNLSKDVLQSDGVRRELYIKSVNEGVRRVEQGQYEQSIEQYEQAIALEPDLSYAYVNLANAYWHLAKYEESIAMSKKALQIDPSDARTYSNLGNAYYSSGKHKEAEDSYKKAKELYKGAGDSEGVKKMEEYLGRL